MAGTSHHGRVLWAALLIAVALTAWANAPRAHDASSASEQGAVEGLNLPKEESLEHSHAQLLATVCCKTCRKGKACGNSCISRTKACHQPPGCACDAK
jgi:predicted lipoprotein